MKKPLYDVVIMAARYSARAAVASGAAAVAQVQGMLFDQGFIGGCAMAPESGLTGLYADLRVQESGH